MAGRTRSVLRTSRFPDPTLTSACSRSVKLNVRNDPPRTGPVPTGRLVAATAGASAMADSAAATSAQTVKDAIRRRHAAIARTALLADDWKRHKGLDWARGRHAP